MKHRLFVAIELPSEHHQLTIALQDKIKGLGLPIKLEPPEKLHLNLNFLGRVNTEQILRLEGELNGVSRRNSPFSLTPQFLETLYQRHESSLIYLSLGGDVSQLKELHRSINESMARLSLPQHRRFLPHVTIGRLDRTDPITTKKLLDRISEIDNSPMPSFTVDHFTLFESFLSRSGSHYQKQKSFKLRV